MQSRLNRRSNFKRYLKKAVKVQRIRWNLSARPGYLEEHLLLSARKMANNLKNCSCSMCCNERNSSWNKGHNKLTVQEQKNFDKYQEDMENL